MKQVVWMILARLADIVSTLVFVKYGTEMNPINNMLLSVSYLSFIIYQLFVGGILIFIISCMTGWYQKSMFWLTITVSFGIAISNTVGYFLFV